MLRLASNLVAKGSKRGLSIETSNRIPSYDGVPGMSAGVLRSSRF
jgi:hypothetical protein